MSYERRKVQQSFETEIDVINLPKEIVTKLTKALRESFDGGIPRGWRVNRINVSIYNSAGIIPDHTFVVEEEDKK